MCMYLQSYRSRPVGVHGDGSGAGAAPPLAVPHAGALRLPTAPSLDSEKDGTRITVQSVTNKMYLSAAGGGGSKVVANGSKQRNSETFRLWKIESPVPMFKIRVDHDQFVSLNDDEELVAVATSPNQTGNFQIISNDVDKSQIQIKAPNGKLLQVQLDGSVKANGEPGGSWSNSDPAVFIIYINESKRMDGDFQLCSFYGANQTVKMLQDHWNSFITEDDFRFISSNGLNAVRIPVAWWITRDSGPPSCHPPNYPGYQAVLDRAFAWADKYNLHVIVDLHAAPGSQNGFAHRGSRDGTVAWGDATSIAMTVQVIEALADRYASWKDLLAIELLNEPLAPKVTLDTLKKYYTAGYTAVKEKVQRSDVYVIMSNRLNTQDPTELVEFTSTFDNCVIDVHYYNLYNLNFPSVKENIDFVKTNRSSQLNSLMRANGARVFVGEWTTEWGVQGANEEDRTSFADVQMDVYGQASFGWAFWSYKNNNTNWSMKDMIEKGKIYTQMVPKNLNMIENMRKIFRVTNESKYQKKKIH
uniref:Uncharacterized protein n=1 Tax=Oryza glumipatula TaxID=40148 RepID=A0A0E0B9L9_9ORYZ